MNEKKSNEENKSFYEKIKTDKKYKAKIELLGYGIVVVLIIIYLNISSVGNNYNYDKITEPAETNKEEVQEEINLLEKLDNNYTYNIDVSMKKLAKDITGKDVETDIKYNYSGKSFEKNLIINKIANNENKDYYKIDNKYYEKIEEQYNEIKEEIIYDILDAKFIEVFGLKNYIETSSLDHYTNYSSGKKEYLYNLKLSDVIPNYKEDKIVAINIAIDNNIVNINVDYTKLLEIYDSNVIECIVNYTYKDIERVEEFVLIEDTNKEENKPTT